jgi:hypothetical protein
VAVIEHVRGRTGMSGFVRDRATGRPLGGARVEVLAGPPAYRGLLGIRARQHGAAWEGMAIRLDRALTAGDGLFHLPGLPPGEYTLRASLPGAGSRYGAVRPKVVLAAEDPGEVALTLPPTLVRGRVTGRGGEPVALAEVRLRGSAERTLTDRDGGFVLAGVECGARVVEVSARGYAPARRVAKLAQPGWERSLDFPLDPAGP